MSVNEQLDQLRKKLETSSAQIAELETGIDSLRTQSEQVSKLEAETAAIEQRYQVALKAMTAQEVEKKTVSDLSALRQRLAREDQLLGRLLTDANEALEEQYPGRQLGDALRDALSDENLSGLPGAERLRALRAPR